MLKIGENPPSRWPQGRSLEEDNGDWWVVRTKSRNEKALAWELTRLGVSYYLPLVSKRTVRRDNGKPRKSVVCLFPGYISVASFPEHKHNLYRTGRIYNALEVVDQDKFIHQLNNVQAAVGSCSILELRQELVAGQSVIINSGPLQGVEGIVCGSRKKPDTIHLNVEMFNRSVSVKVPREVVVPLHDNCVAN